MDFMDYFASAWLGLLSVSPIIVAWIIGIVIAARMMKRGGGKAERLLLIGCCLMLAESLVSPFSTVLMLWLIAERAISAQGYGFTMSIARIPLAIISLAGIVCLVYAFWIKFRSSLRREQGDGSRKAT